MEEAEYLGLMEISLKIRGYTFCGGNSPSIADFQLFAEFKDLDYLSRGYSNYPVLTKWHDLLR